MKKCIIIGSGIVGTTLAYLLTKNGHTVDIFERGKDYPYPYSSQFESMIIGGADRAYFEDHYLVPKDVRDVAQEGNYRPDIIGEQITVLGGKAAIWGATTPRMSPGDFKVKSLHRYSEDWPITYDELEPYYCKAEALLGVSGTVADNPFAPWRSVGYPLPQFDLGYSARIFAERLHKDGIAVSTGAQARTRVAYDGRPGCVNFGTCRVCPIGVRYSPGHHLQKALATSRCRVHTQASVRRILLDSSRRARGISYQLQDAKAPVEQEADLVILAGGPIESSRLLLLSSDTNFKDGIGNQSGHVGKNFFMHSCYNIAAAYREALYGGRTSTGFGVSFQFVDSPQRGKHGGMKLNLWDHPFSGPEGDWLGKLGAPDFTEWKTGQDIVKALATYANHQTMGVDVESLPGPGKYVGLSDKRDRFGDPTARLHYEFDDFDIESKSAAMKLLDRVVAATQGQRTEKNDPDADSGHHHMGGLRMSASERDGVVDALGRVYGTTNLFVLGGGTFPSFSAVNPTLTMVALAIRTAEHIHGQPA